MQSEVHVIQSKLLKPHIQYILYNQNHSSETSPIQSYPNTNICLGIINNSRLANIGEHYKPDTYDGLFTYTNGLHTKPHTFSMGKQWDEICIDFNPCSYYYFFDIPSQPQLFDCGYTEEVFKPKEQNSLQKIFDEPNLYKRTEIIEAFLLRRLRKYDQPVLLSAINIIHQKKGLVTIKEILFQVRCSERKLYTVFKNHFEITPKQYIRIYRIRRAIQMVLLSTTDQSLTDIAYACGYADQSHFIKESKSLCEVLPKHLKKRLDTINNQVIIGKN